MHCPRCNREGLNPSSTCSYCGFSGPPGQVEHLGHIAYLLGELETWHEVEPPTRERLRSRYLGQRQEIEITLGLRPRPLTAEEARMLQRELFCLEALQKKVAFWLEQGWVHPRPAEKLQEGGQKRAESLRRQLAEVPPAPAFDSVQDRLKLFDYLQQMLNLARLRGHFVDDTAYAAALGNLQADRRELESRAGLRPRLPEPVAVPEAVPAAPVPVPAVEAAPLAPPRPRRESITWDRIWQTLLSRRTLNVLLFLGAFLLIASATTYVVYNWEKLPPAAQLAFIVLFTLSFYAAGWFLRVRMKLRASGIAVTAVGSLLVPLDFYAIFVAGGVLPFEMWSWVWLIASAVCLPTYTFTALRIRAEFFGYTVAVAMGSLLCAALQVMSVPPEWWLAPLVALALSLAFLAYRLKPEQASAEADQSAGATPNDQPAGATPGETAVEPPPPEPEAAKGGWSILSTPLRFSALVTTSAILPLGLGWWIAGQMRSFDLNASLAGAWILGAVLYAYAAIRERSPLLGRAAATALPAAVFLLLRLAFEPLHIELPWYALGWAALAPVYLVVGHRLAPPQSLQVGRKVGEANPPAEGTAEGQEVSLPPAGGTEGEHTADPVLRAHDYTAASWGLALMAIAAVWSVFDLWAAATTHAVLVFAAALAVRLWDKPRALPIASLLALSSITFAMAAGHLEPAELCLGWALLAVLHVLAALRLRAAPEYAARLFAAALVVAALALLPPLVLGHEPLLTYVLGHWIALAAWLVWLDHTGEHPGLEAFLSRFGPLRHSALHWAISLPLPFFITMLYTRFRAPDACLGLLMAALAWACFAVGQLRHLSTRQTSNVKRPSSFGFHHWSFPWYVVGYGCSLAAPALAFYFYDQPLLAVTVLLAAALYFTSAWAFRSRWWLIPAGLALPVGLLILLDFWAVPWPRQSVALALVPAAYLLAGIGLERRRGVSRKLMAPLYIVAHLAAVVAVGWGLEPAIEQPIHTLPWSDSARLWAAAGQLILAITYGLVAWFHGQERWAHVAAWLGVLAGGLIASAYSQGRGSSAFKAALLAVVYILAERALASETSKRRWPPAERAWPLYRRALLIAGWAVSGAAIALALIRNLVLLGGGRSREIWSIVALLTITALYALSAWMFRRRVLVWLAGILIVAPWTLLTLWGWFLWDAPPPLPRYALSWAILACLELILGLFLTGRTRSPQAAEVAPMTPDAGQGRLAHKMDYGLPLRVVANVLLPFALFWAVADPATSGITWGLGAAFYVASAAADHRRGLSGWRGARFLYPAVAVTPVWALYRLNYFWPAAPYEIDGLLLLAFALPLLAVGRLLRRIDPADGLPLYLGAYGMAVVGTLLVAHQRPLFAAILTFDALLCVLSAWIFREPLWGYPAAALAPAAMLVALAESQVPPDRRGWWLIALGAVYLALALRLDLRSSGQAWLLYHGGVRKRAIRLRPYSTPPLAAAFAVVALGLPPSSLDDVGALWGYLAAALIYAVAAASLRQPLLLTPAAALLAVPYGVAVVWLGVKPADYGLAIFPGVVATLAVAHLLDWRLGRPAPKPVGRESIPPSASRAGIAGLRTRLGALLDWWAAPFYAWGYIGALVAVGLSLRLDLRSSGQAWTDPRRLAIALALAAMTFLHATWRFRSRGALLLAGALAQAAALAVIDAAGWLSYPTWAALAFLPVTVLTAALALAVEHWRREGSPLSAAWLSGWSRPLYLLLAADLLGGQIAALFHSEPGAIVTVAHALLLALLATVWAQPFLPFVAAALGVVGFLQGMVWAGVEFTGYPIGLAALALGWGLAGYELRCARWAGRRAQIWCNPLEWTAVALSAVALLWVVVASLDVTQLVVRTILGRAVTLADYAPQVQMLMWVLALTGLLYLATAVVRRWYVLGYGAVALLLGAWALWWRFFVEMPGFQWYAVPAGLYLLGIGWLEWRQGRKVLARWIDRAGMLVWLGSTWWQSIPGVMERGWPYALIMGAEALLLVWWGSSRRQKWFLYIGVVAVVVDVITQSIAGMLGPYRWIVLGVVGLLVMGIAVLVERKLEAIRGLSVELRERLEGWE